MNSNSSLAQGGIAAVIRPPDSFQKHINDTMNVGRGLSDIEAVKTLVYNGPEQIEWLQKQGVEFSTINGKLDLTREGGHSSRRVIHSGDITGYNIQRKLIENARKNSSLQILEDTMAVELLIKRGKCLGVKALDVNNNRLIEIHSDNTILATGGVGQLYLRTSNPLIATGDGIAIAWRAGAILRDLEFVQFHPTILDYGESPYFLISEAVRGEGGILLNSEKEAFMTRYHSLKDLAPRDVVSRAIIEEQKKGQVYINIRERDKQFLEERFPGIYKECLNRGIRMDKDLIPVSPAAHYFCGGAKVDVNSSTNIDNLLVIGEMSCTGVHGANRMASNSLLECLVFSKIATDKIDESENKFPEISIGEKLPEIKETSNLRDNIQQIMWNYVGINRELDQLEEALSNLDEIYLRAKKEYMKNLCVQTIETWNLACIAKLIAKAAFTRRESRGTHMLNDYPVRNDADWLKHIEFKEEKMIIVEHKN